MGINDRRDADRSMEIPCKELAMDTADIDLSDGTTLLVGSYLRFSL